MRKDQLKFSWRMPACGALALLAASCAGAEEPRLRYAIVAKHPHDTAAFTQGLAVLDGKLLEGTGRYGASLIALKDVASGATLRARALDARHFGEGVARAGDRIVQLTWQSGVALLYDLALRPLGEIAYEGEGWGLAYDGSRLLMSDGSDRIQLRRPDTFARTGTLRVRAGGRPLARLNELEYAGGWLYANVWLSDRIAVIDPGDGVVRAWLDLAALRRQFARPRGWNEDEHVLNGIAHDPASGHFFVTGKCWPVLFELRVRTLPPPQAGVATPQSL